MWGVPLGRRPARCARSPPTSRTRRRSRRQEELISPEYIGYAAGLLTVASYVPQVVRTWRTKETKDLSWGMFGLLVTAAVLWIAYGARSSQWPVIATSVGCGLLNVAILAAKIRYR